MSAAAALVCVLLLIVVSADIGERCLATYTSFVSKCTLSMTNLSSSQLSDMVCKAGNCHTLFNQEVMADCQNDAEFKPTLDLFELICSPCMEAFLMVNSSCVTSNVDERWNMTATCSDGLCHTARTNMDMKCASLLQEAPAHRRVVKVGAVGASRAVADLVAGIARSNHRRLQTVAATADPSHENENNTTTDEQAMNVNASEGSSTTNANDSTANGGNSSIASMPNATNAGIERSSSEAMTTSPPSSVETSGNFTDARNDTPRTGNTSSGDNSLVTLDISASLHGNASSSRNDAVVDLVTAIQEVSMAIDRLCNPCLQDMNRLPAVCSFGDGFDPSVHPEQVAEVCEAGPCKSLLEGLTEKCQNQSSGIEPLMAMVRMVCEREPCNSALMALPENCTTVEGPDPSKACASGCFEAFSDMVASCPANPVESPMLDVPLSSYKVAVQGLASSVSSCWQGSPSTTGIWPVSTTTSRESTTGTRVNHDFSRVNDYLSSAIGVRVATTTSIVLTVFVLLTNSEFH